MVAILRVRTMGEVVTATREGLLRGSTTASRRERTGMRGRGEGMTTREEPQGHFCPFDCLSFLFFAIYFNQYQWCYVIGVDGGFV